MDPVKIAILGGGNIGARHLRTATAEAGCEVVGVVDPSLAAADVAKAAGVPHYRDLDSLLASGRPDGVIVAAPTGLHYEIGRACIDHGLHMLMEKPIAASIEDGEKLVAAAKKAGVRVATGHHRRFDPAVEVARDIVAGGELGRLIAVSAIWLARKPDPYFEIPWRQQTGAGPVLTNLIHDIDLLRHVCGEIDSVYAETSGGVRSFEIEDTAAIVLRFRSGALATVTLSDAAPSPWGWEQGTDDNPDLTATGENCYFFAGTEGSLGFPKMELWHHPDRRAHGWADPIDRTVRPLRPRQAFADQLRNFCGVIRGTEEPRVSGLDGLATLAATVAVHQSAERGGPVTPAVTL